MRTNAVSKTLRPASGVPKGPNISALAQEVRGFGPLTTLNIFRREKLAPPQMAEVLSEKIIPIEDTDCFLWSSGISDKRAAEIASHLTIRRATGVFPKLDTDILLKIRPEIVSLVFNSPRILLEDVADILFGKEPEDYRWTSAVINNMTPTRVARVMSENYQLSGIPITSYAAHIFGNRQLSLTNAARILEKMAPVEASAVLAFGIGKEISFARAAAFFARMLGHRVVRILTVTDDTEDYLLSKDRAAVDEILNRLRKSPHKKTILSLLPEE